MNVLLLAAGKGQRFLDAGYNKPKPLIEVNGVPMWKLVLDNILSQLNNVTQVVIATKEEYGIVSDDYTVVNLVGEQKGAAWSALETYGNFKKPNENLLILNVDQLIEFNRLNFNTLLHTGKWDGILMHFWEPNKETKWGRSELDDWGIYKIVEKMPVTPFAHTGHYIFYDTEKFYSYAQEMIDLGIKVNGEYFLSPIYNLMIDDGMTVLPFMVDKFVGLGLPEDLEKYLRDGN